MDTNYNKYKQELQKLKRNKCDRHLIPFKKCGQYIYEDNKQYLNLSSNDYLGLAENKEIIDKFYKFADFSFGSTSSRLLTGGSSIYAKLECLLASLFEKDKALIFNSGYHANTGIMSALLDKKDVVFCDKLNHASILDGIKLSDSKMFRYKHLDYDNLEELLKKHRKEYENAIIVSESVFSMDGDIADLNKLIELKNKYNAILVVDEAHAYGVFGDKGLGISEVQNCTKDIDLIVATFGKAIGSMGAFCVGDEVLVNYLINKSRSLIFSTALPEINIAFSYYIISEILPNLRYSKKSLLSNAQKLREKLKNLGLQTMGESQIVPVILGSNSNAVACSKALIDNGYYLMPIRHPTVAPNSARVRISLRADISYEDIAYLPDLISKKMAQLNDNQPY